MGLFFYMDRHFDIWKDRDGDTYIYKIFYNYIIWYINLQSGHGQAQVSGSL